MTKTIAIRNSHDIPGFHADRAAEARGLRHALVLTIMAATVFAGLALFAAQQPRAMQLNATAGEADIALAYAEPVPERFGGALDGVFSRDQEHELNDAWMGMTAVSSDGVVLGYVTDAFINEDGSVDEIVIAPAGDGGALSTAVYVPASYAELGGESVHVALDARAVARLEPATDLAMAGE
ncbi:PRC-barrel domain-containing protein [Oricola nitratireducens]|uniref:PRC-barrel domain-containing protein n=1 Tax=Oricola nitratireducens TaxID=2775868 RepID=UPI0018681192|nr:PRC-barrel domain-containing protein [Oricola nitratireducens]